MAENITSIIDQPVTLSGREDLSAKDKFGITRYERALTEFIRRADTPLTIALQGEWGSGKTSLMNLLKYHLCEADDAQYFPVWINTWQYSIMSNPESSIVSILQGIIYQLGNAVGESDEKKQKIGNMFANVGKIAAIAAMNIAGKVVGAGAVGSEINDAAKESKEQESDPITGDSKIAELRRSIADFITLILKNEAGKSHPRKGFLFFIDDLDRIDPPVAVQILELLKNIFDLEHCIYVLAIDYDVVVKGLKPKFGELTDKNAREFRSFFDKIIQLPFAMPVGSYRIDNFLIDALGRIGYLTDEEKQNEELKSNLSEMARYSVGTNPRSLKRLTNILSLIQLMAEDVDNGSSNADQPTSEEKLIDKQVNFGLVCLQIVYPLVYNTLLEYPNFRHWGDETADSVNGGKILLAKKLSLQELSKEQQSKLEKQGELFDEPWEKMLFRICLKDSYLSSRANDISLLLNKISSLVPMGQGEDKASVEKEHDDAVAEMIDRLIRFSAVTNVHVTEETVAAKKIEDFNHSWWLKQFRDKFVPTLNSLFGGEETVRCTNGRVVYKLYIRHEKMFKEKLTGDEAYITMGHDDKSYNVCWGCQNLFLRGGFESIEKEEQLLGCSGLHDSVVAEIRKCAEKYPEIKVEIQDQYNGEGRKTGFLAVGARFHANTLEELVSAEAVRKMAEFVREQYSIRLKMIRTEQDALNWGHDNKLREQLKNMDLAPFTKTAVWWSGTFLVGYKLGANNFGITLWLQSTGFLCIMWEGAKHDGGHNERIITELLNAKPTLREIFSGHKEGDWFWSHPEIIPFDGVIDWLKNLQKVLIALQQEGPAQL